MPDNQDQGPHGELPKGEYPTHLGNITLRGASGEAYDFSVFPLFLEFNTRIGAIYLVTERYLRDGREWRHRILFLDQTASLPAYFKAHRNTECFERFRANCICVHTENDENVRLAVFHDLAEAIPTPCN